MFRLVSIVIRLIVRTILALIVISLVISVVFVAIRVSQPMQLKQANGMTYWQFLNDRLGVIMQKPAKCQELHILDYVLGVTIYPALYTFVGIFPDSFLARHTMPYPLIPKNVKWYEAPNTWWSLVEAVSWDAWVTPHLPSIMPECNLKSPER
jgi:hypothetical protein